LNLEKNPVTVIAGESIPACTPVYVNNNIAYSTNTNPIKFNSFNFEWVNNPFEIIETISPVAASLSVTP
jgi:hypothetical protein